MSSPEMEIDENDSAGPAAAQMIDDPDDDTLRIMVSTDNHLGYNERDPVRGMDSFAAFEEVLYLAKRFHCDMVLIGGDLFHHNKPSRPTLYKAMEIIRHYCMGDNPVRIQILSDQAKNFETGVVNYQDPNYSVDLPIFSIHGNHDDPVRDGTGKAALAALDLLSVSNLVNYIGKQDKIDQVEISPVLLQKGDTKVALFGLGSMRDERLNRMWNGHKVRFLRPSEDVTEGEDEDEAGFFNIFTLHQNRDLGRGSKNCIQESMIPEWMDLVVWGHEHECLIEIFESVVGTFRITQPGSSVATSLVAGEAARKKVGILDIKGQQFRLKTIPLTQVRSFVTTELSLREHREELDPEDPRVEEQVGEVLEEEVRVMVLNARERRKEVLEEALAVGSDAGTDDSPLKFKMEKPHEVLVRVRVEHSGFTTLNSQRFGAKFVGEVANPEDILLFHRKKDPSGAASKSRPSKKNLEPIPPEQSSNMEDLTHEMLQENPDPKMMILSEKKIRESLEDFVDKSMVSSIDDASDGMLSKRQKMLITGANVASTNKQDKDANDLGDESPQHETEKARPQKRKADHLDDSIDESGLAGKENNSSMNLDDDEDDDDFAATAASTKRRNAQGNAKRRTRDDSDAESDAPQRSRGRNTKAASSTKRGARVAQGNSKRKAARREKLISLDSDNEDDVEDVDVVEMSTKARPKRASRGKTVSYMDDSDDYQPDEDDDDIVEVVENPKRKSNKNGTTGRSARKKTSTTEGTSRRTARAAKPKFDDSDEDAYANTADLDDDWGTATTRSQG